MAATGIDINREARQILRDGSPIRMSSYEYDLIIFLVENLGKALTYRKIAEKWSDSNYIGYKDNLVVQQHICRIRAKIPELQITTMRNYGYRPERIIFS